MHQATDLLVWGIIVHLVADWLFQTEWMATFKMDLRHPAAWVHSGIHTIGFCFIFAWPLAVLIGFTHLLIDTRKPLIWWMKVIKQIPADAHFPIVEVALDQVMHITVVAGTALCSVWFGLS